MKVVIGRTVHYRGQPYEGTPVYPATITRVLESEGDTRNGPAKVDLISFPPLTTPQVVAGATLTEFDPGGDNWGAFVPPQL